MVTLRFILTRIYYVLALLPLLTVRKVLNLLLSIIRFLLKTDRSVGSPPIAILTVTTECNYECVMCLRNTTVLHDMIPFADRGDMKFGFLEAFIRQHADHLCLVRLHGGEPLYYKNIVQVLELLNEVKVPYNIITNGALLTESISRRLIEGYCVGVGVSLDAANPSTYAAMRRGGSLELVASNIDRLNKLKRQLRAKRPVLSASMCTFSFNIGEMAEVVAFCARHGIPALSVGEGWDYKTAGVRAEHLLAAHVDLVHDSIRKAAREAKKRGIILRTRFPALARMRFKDIPFHAGRVSPKNCLNLYASIWLLPNADAVGCSAVTTSFGNLERAGFAKVWNGEEYGYVKARRAFRITKTHDACKQCPYEGGFWS